MRAGFGVDLGVVAWSTLVATSVALSACATDGALITSAALDPAAITPNQDGDRDVARLSYGLSAPASVTLTLTGDGGTYVLRDGNRRLAGAYEALFGGVVDGRMIPDGEYVARLEAVPSDGGRAETRELALSVSGGDAAAPELSGFEVHPDRLTPNQDGLGDQVVISYRLDQPAEVRVYITTPDGEFVADVLENEDSATLAGEPGPHEYIYDAGVEADAPPPPDGDYLVVAEATDQAGNVTRETRPLSLELGGQPRAALFGDVEWSSTVLPLGDTLTFTSTVRNVGDTPIRTRGPESGVVYDNTKSFNTTPPAGFVILAKPDGGGPGASAWVPAGPSADDDLVLDLAITSAASYPAGATGMEAQSGLPAAVSAVAEPLTQTVCGRVERSGEPESGATVTAFEVDGDGLAQRTAGPDGTFCFEDLPVPEPHDRSFARSPGAIRLGLEYDDLSDLEYPFRWQLGRTAELDVCEADGRLYLCLMPGKEVTVTGGVRFTEPPIRRSTNVYLALMHEDGRQMHGPYGVQAVTVEHE
jgi:hypothetical protein